jgi:hypothetical protein
MRSEIVGRSGERLTGNEAVGVFSVFFASRISQSPRGRFCCSHVIYGEDSLIKFNFVYKYKSKGIYSVSQNWHTNDLIPYRGCLNIHEKNMEKILQTYIFKSGRVKRK